MTAVLNVSHNVPSLFQPHFQYLEIRVPDTYQADLLSRLDEAFTFIGKSRGSVCLVIYDAMGFLYLMLHLDIL